MNDSKNTSILLRLTKEEKEKITSKAKSLNKSTNKFLKNLILNNIDNIDKADDTKDDIANDINQDIIDLLKEQLTIKDEQIHNLQTIIFNRDSKLIELSKKHWWEFWK